jgi:hypothetical protein
MGAWSITVCADECADSPTPIVPLSAEFCFLVLFVQVIANTRYILTVGDDPHRVYYKSAQHWTVNELGEKVRLNSPAWY